MTAGLANFIIEQGATFTSTIVWQDANLNPIDLTGYMGEMRIITPANVDPQETLYILTEGNSNISFDRPNGKIFLYISAGDTSTFNWTRGLYKLILTSGSDIYNLLTGGIKVND